MPRVLAAVKSTSARSDVVCETPSPAGRGLGLFRSDSCIARPCLRGVTSSGLNPGLCRAFRVCPFCRGIALAAVSLPRRACLPCDDIPELVPRGAAPTDERDPARLAMKKCSNLQGLTHTAEMEKNSGSRTHHVVNQVSVGCNTTYTAVSERPAGCTVARPTLQSCNARHMQSRFMFVCRQTRP
jgi:hypothetical protein